MGRRGQRLTAEQKKRLSDVQKQRFRENLALRTAEPDHKRCSKCREVKPIDQFYAWKKPLKSGGVALRPSAACKVCQKRYRKETYRRLKAEGVDVKAIKKRYYENEDPEKRRARWRAWAAKRRREEGRPEVGPRVQAQTARGGERLDVEPLALFLEKERESRSFAAICEACKVDQRRLVSILGREEKQVSLRIVDTFLSGLGVPHELHVLYPHTELNVGYRIISD